MKGYFTLKIRNKNYMFVSPAFREEDEFLYPVVYEKEEGGAKIKAYFEGKINFLLSIGKKNKADEQKKLWKKVKFNEV